MQQQPVMFTISEVSDYLLHRNDKTFQHFENELKRRSEDYLQALAEVERFRAAAVEREGKKGYKTAVRRFEKAEGEVKNTRFLLVNETESYQDTKKLLADDKWEAECFFNHFARLHNLNERLMDGNRVTLPADLTKEPATLPPDIEAAVFSKAQESNAQPPAAGQQNYGRAESD